MSSNHEMFTKGMKFLPTEHMTQDQLNTVVVEILRRVFVTDRNEMLPVPNESNSMRTLVQFLLDLDMMFDEEAFATFPEHIKSLFMVKHRDGKEYRFGRKPRWL